MVLHLLAADYTADFLKVCQFLLNLTLELGDKLVSLAF